MYRLSRWLLLTAIVSAPPAAAQTIQLPSFHSFSVDTTVVVPDSGPARVAGTRRARAAQNRVGAGARQRTTSIERQANGVAVLAEIHDPRQADAALLRQAQAERANQRGVARLPLEGRTAAIDPPVVGVNEAQRRRADQAASRQREVQAIVAKARVAEANGKPAVAAVYYRQAARLATGELRAEISARLDQLSRVRADVTSKVSRVPN